MFMQLMYLVVSSPTSCSGNPLITTMDFPRRTTSQVNQSPHLLLLKVYQAISNHLPASLFQSGRGHKNWSISSAFHSKGINFSIIAKFLNIKFSQTCEPPAESLTPSITGEICTIKIFMVMGFDTCEIQPDGSGLLGQFRTLYMGHRGPGQLGDLDIQEPNFHALDLGDHS